MRVCTCKKILFLRNFQISFSNRALLILVNVVILFFILKLGKLFLSIWILTWYWKIYVSFLNVNRNWKYVCNKRLGARPADWAEGECDLWLVEVSFRTNAACQRFHFPFIRLTGRAPRRLLHAHAQLYWYYL